jgi:hypothetical protein
MDLVYRGPANDKHDQQEYVCVNLPKPTQMKCL